MKKVVSKYLLICIFTIISTACGNNNSTATTETAPQQTEDSSSLILPPPTVPVTMTDPADRGRYIMTHFWDALDFTDTVRSHNQDLIEQNFANYVALFSIVDEEDLKPVFKRLITRSAADTTAFNLIRRVADKYLYDPNSPMQNEDYYGIFISQLVEDENVSEADRMRYKFEIECIAKNRQGTIASDFSYIDRTGKRNTLLHTLSGQYLMLIFFDPDCEECKTAIAHLRASKALNAMIANGKVTVLAVYAEGDMECWEKAKSEMPDNWIVACDTSNIEENDTYILRAMPSIYILDPSKHILIKDTTADRAMAIIER